MKKVSYFLILILGITGCTQGLSSMEQPTSIYPTITINDFSDSEQPSSDSHFLGDTASTDLDVYFTSPEDLYPGDYSGGIDDHLVASIDSAKMSVDMAAYSINLWSVRDALIRAYRRGLVVRIVLESDNINDEVPRQLRSAGLSMIGDRQEGLMHNKFVVIDKTDVWTGSANMTIGSFYYDNNNLVHIHSKEIAEDFTTEFEEMYIRDMFGPDVVPETPYPEVMVGEKLVEVYFSPDDHVSDQIYKLIGDAQESIFFMAFSFTSNALGDAIVEKSKSGVLVAGIMDGDQVDSNTGTEYDLFRNAGIKLSISKNDGLMHHKVIIIDQKIVITGSYNFSQSAEGSNDENVIVIHDQDIAKKYLDEFNKIISNIPK